MIPKRPSPTLKFKMTKTLRNLFENPFGKKALKREEVNRKKAFDKSVSRFGETKAIERRTLARELTRGRLRDSQSRALLWWNISFNATLKQTNLALGVDLAKFVREHAPTGESLKLDAEMEQQSHN